jgi:hypothetical protein
LICARTVRIVAAVVTTTAAFASLALVSAGAAEPEILRLRANSVDLNNRVRTESLDIVVERWSTPEEAAKLKAVLVEKGGDKLLDTLQKVKPRCGYVKTSTSLGWDIYFAREVELPGGGRKISLASDRPISYWEASNNPRSKDYEFSLAEIHLGADGKGEGKAIKAAMVSFDKEKNTLEIENYQREPVRLNQVEVVAPKPKK